MHSSILYMMTLTLLVVIQSTYVQVQASPIPIPAASEKPDDAGIGSASVKPYTSGPVYEAMDPSKMDIFERAEDATAKFLAKRDQDAATFLPIKPSAIDAMDTFLSKRAAAVPEDRDLSVEDDRIATTEAVFEPMDPAMMIAFERAEDATEKFMARQSGDLGGLDPVEKRATDEDHDLSIGDGNNSEKRETSGVGIRPIPPPPRCPEVCPMIYQPLCAYNNKGVKRTFGNECELGKYNCNHPYSSFKEVSKGECDKK